MRHAARLTIEALGGELDDGESTAGGRRDRSPGFVQADDATPGLEQMPGDTRSEEFARAGDDGRGEAGRSWPGRRAPRLGPADRSGNDRPPWRIPGHPSVEKLSRSAPIIRASRSRAASTVAGRPSAVERSGGLGAMSPERQVDVQGRGEQLGRQAGGDAAQRQLGRQGSGSACAARRHRRAPRSGGARCRSGPGRRPSREPSGSGPSWSCRRRSGPPARRAPAARRAWPARASWPRPRATDARGSPRRNGTARPSPRPPGIGQARPACTASRIAWTPARLVG